jgi:Zn-dependent protease with chaperone function
MHYSVYAGLGFASLFGLIAPFIARRVSPAIATWLLSTGGVVSAISAVGALGLLAMTLIGQYGAVAAEGHWSIPALRHSDPVRWPVSTAALAVLGIGIGRLLWVLLQRGRALAAAHRLNRSVGDTGSDLVVLPDTAPDAYAVPGRPGRVFVTHGMLKLLSRDEFDVMLAHERSHLRHHHHWHRTAAVVASALNPLLCSLPSTQVLLTERWADEDAARGNDRALVASALSRAAAADRTGPRPAGALALTSNTVERRVAALLDDPPRYHPVMLAIAIAILMLSVVGTLDGITDEAHLFHAAISVHYEQIGHLRRVFAHTMNSQLIRSASHTRRT